MVLRTLLLLISGNTKMYICTWNTHPTHSPFGRSKNKLLEFLKHIDLKR